MRGVERCQSKQTNKQASKQANKQANKQPNKQASKQASKQAKHPQKCHNQTLTMCLHGESLLNEWGKGVFIPGVSHFADDPPSSAHRHPNKENKSKEKEFGRQSGRVVTELNESH